MKHKSIIFTFICLVIMTAFLLSACSGIIEIREPEITVETGGEREEGEAPQIQDLGGYNYRIIGHGLDEQVGLSISLVSEELNTDVVNNAQYRRNEKVKDLYDIGISTVLRGDAYLLADTFAGEDLADAYFVPERFHYGNTVEYAVNLLDVPTMRMDQPYWDQDHNEAVTVDGVLQTGVGDIYASEELHLTAIVMNNKLFTDLGHDVEQFQSDVLDGKWYYDEMYGYMKEGTRDLDGIPGMTTSDQFGLLCGFDVYWQLYNASGLDVIERDEDGDYRYTVEGEETLAAFNVFENVCTSSDISPYPDLWGYMYDHSGMNKGFTKNRGLFCMLGIGGMESLRNMDADYTILPIPKIYESTDRYFSVADGFSTIVWIPKTVSSINRTGLITEALAYYSDEYQSALYEKVLMEKYARDPVSQKLLATVFENVHWQMDEQMLIGDFRQKLCHRWAEARQGITAFGSQTKNFVSDASENLEYMLNALREAKNNNQR